MSTNKAPGTGRNQPKDSSGTDSDNDTLHSPHGQRNTEKNIQPTGLEAGTSGESHNMDWEPTTGIPKSPPAYYKPLQSTIENKTGILKIEDMRNITTDLYKTKLSSDQSYPKPFYSHMLSAEKKNDVLTTPKSATMTTPYTGLSTAGPSGFKAQIQNLPIMTKDHTDDNAGTSRSKARVQSLPIMTKDHTDDNAGTSRSKARVQSLPIMTKDHTDISTAGTLGFNNSIQSQSVTSKDKGQNISGPSGAKDSVPNPLDILLTKKKLSETYELGDACRFFLTYMKSKRTQLKYQEGQLDSCTSDIQKALTDAEQICLKLEAEPETVAEEIEAAITQSNKLVYLLAVSHRCFRNLDELGTKLKGALQTYTNDAENFHLSSDRLLEYIMETIFEKCRQLGTL